MPEQAKIRNAPDPERSLDGSGATQTSKQTTPLFDSPAPEIASQAQRKTTLERASLIMGMVIPVVLGWATWSLTNQQWQTQQRQYLNSVQEQDSNRVLDRLLVLGSSATPDRLSAAKALRSYADLNRMDAATLPGLLPYLKSECDGDVFRIEKEAALQAAHNSSAQSSVDTNTRQQLAVGIAAIELSPQCLQESKSTATSVPASGPTVVTAPPQYLDVGCGEAKTGTLEVDVPGPSSGNQRIRDVSATLANVDNLKSWSVRVVGHTDRSASVAYSLVGLDRQFLGNCPGGGHGSVHPVQVPNCNCENYLYGIHELMLSGVGANVLKVFAFK